MEYQKVDPNSGVAIFKGDPRTSVKDIDKWYENLLGDYKDLSRSDNRPYLYGSDAGFCARRNVLLEHNDVIESLENTAGTAFMAIGTALENLLADALMRGGRLLAQNQRLVQMPEVKVSGKIDFIVFDHADQLALIECKSCGDLPVQPKPTHLAQIQTYAAVSGVDTAYLTYVSRKIVWRQPLAMKTFVVDTSEAAMFEKLRIAALSRLASDRKVVPEVPAHFRKHTECHFCEFRDYYCFAQRPGQGGGLPALPGGITALDSPALIALDMEAQVLAQAMLFERSERLKATIQDLWLSKDTFSKENRSRLKTAFEIAKAKGGVSEGVSPSQGRGTI